MGIGMDDELSSRHKHTLTYQLKTDDEGHYTGRVIEIPSVIVQGLSEDEIDGKIENVVLEYFDTFKSEHERILNGQKPNIEVPENSYGYTVKRKKFTVNC